MSDSVSGRASIQCRDIRQEHAADAVRVNAMADDVTQENVAAGVSAMADDVTQVAAAYPCVSSALMTTDHRRSYHILVTFSAGSPASRNRGYCGYVRGQFLSLLLCVTFCRKTPMTLLTAHHQTPLLPSQALPRLLREAVSPL